MESGHNSSKVNEIAKLNPIIENIKSRYILSKIYDNISKRKKLLIVRYNKRMQNRLNLTIKNYEKFLEIEIEIIPTKDKYGKFININENNKLYYHIYFNDNKGEINNKYAINKEDKVIKIKIIIDNQVKSFKKIFCGCECIESINFKKFYRNNITDMSCMFSGCSSLRELNLSNFNTNNVTNMSCMFSGCSSLRELNLSNFNTNNVTDMYRMFSECSLLKDLNLSNFNTNNVTIMSGMFSGCLSLKELNLSNFNTNNVTNMLSMFGRCSDDLKRKIKSENKNIKDHAFY